jgi:DNA invertase Pin-like site-specific DNA recombinase
METIHSNRFHSIGLHLMAIIQTLEQKNVGVRILNLGMDTKTPTGKLMLTVLGRVAQFEREIMLERQREGVAKAKVAGKYKGRKPIAKNRQQEVIRLAAEGMSKANIARQVGIGEATVFRILKTAKSL